MEEIFRMWGPAAFVLVTYTGLVAVVIRWFMKAMDCQVKINQKLVQEHLAKSTDAITKNTSAISSLQVSTDGLMGVIRSCAGARR